MWTNVALTKLLINVDLADKTVAVDGQKKIKKK